MERLPKTLMLPMGQSEDFVHESVDFTDLERLGEQVFAGLVSEEGGLYGGGVAGGEDDLAHQGGMESSKLGVEFLSGHAGHAQVGDKTIDPEFSESA